MNGINEPKYLTDQEAFDRVARHLLTQNKKSEDDDRCLYLTNDGLMCAGGCFVLPDKYDENFEGKSINTIFDEGLGDIFMYQNKVLLEKFQNIHDNYSVEFWGNRLIKLAEEYGLSAHMVHQFDKH